MNENRDEQKVVRDFRTKKEQVEYLLEKFPQTRENDFYLQYLWLKIFGKLSLPFIEWNTIKDISGTLETVSRVRRKIQNENCKFLPSNDVRIHRLKKRKTIYNIINKI
jgi:hypothetical protein